MNDDDFLLSVEAATEEEVVGGEDRRFDPHKKAVSPEAKALVGYVTSLILEADRRSRKRKQADQAVFEATVSALVCDLVSTVHAGDQRWTRLEMSKQALAPATRRAAFMTEKFPETVRLLCNEGLGLVELQAAESGRRQSRQSTMRPTAKFCELIERHGVRPGSVRREQEVVELRGRKVWEVVRGRRIGKATRMSWPTTEAARTIQQQMEVINDWLSEAQLDLWFDPTKPVDLGDRSLKRIFNEGSLDLGGRLYGGFWQSMSAEDRLRCICLDDEDVVGLDFGQTSIRMAYAEVGVLPPPGDLYAVPTISMRGAVQWSDYRDEVKVVMNSLLASDADLDRFPQGGRGRIPKHAPFERLFGDICRYHAPIVGLFGDGRGLQTMKKESDVLIDVLLRLREIGVHALPVHDGIYVPESAAQSAQAIMEVSFEKLIGVPANVSMERLASSTVAGVADLSDVPQGDL